MAGVSAVSGVRMSFFAQDRNPVAVDQQPGALIGIGDHACADDDSLVRFELDFQGHACSPLTLSRVVDCPPADSHPSR
ncbi:hypothetical protein V1273_004929 [Bradyrhizobium sp. AZCC 1721]